MTAEPTTPFRHSGLGISVEVPSGWSVGGSETFPLQLFAPVRQEYRSNLLFSLERFTPPTSQGLEAFMARVGVDQVEQYPGFVEESRREFELDGHPAVVQRYRWEPGAPVPAMAQLLALVVLDAGLLLEVDGATLAALADEVMPELVETLESVRVLGTPES